MAQPAKAQEPSMEEILASIRRIIADDDTPKAPPPRAPDPPAAVQPPPRPAAPPPRPPAPPPRAAQPLPPPPTPAIEVARKQNEIDAMLAQLNNAAADPEPAEEPASDILDLTEAMTSPPPPPPATFRTIDAQSDVFFEEDPAPPPPPAPRPEPVRSAPVEAEQLVSRATSSAVDSAFNTLAQTVLIQNARTLEYLVREMLRPLLKTWLDDNLPGLVERLVRTEIERVSRGRQS
jgi:hypothetical protein